MNIKLIATDLDGTLMQKDHVSISERTVKAIQKASEKGIYIAVASGRTWVNISKVLVRLGVTDYALLSNGALTVDTRNDKIIYSETMPYEKWHNLFDILLQHEAVFELFYEGKSYIETAMLQKYVTPNLPAVFIEELTASVIAYENVRQKMKGLNIEKFNVLVTPEKHMAHLTSTLKQFEDFAVTSAIPGNLEITRKGVNKGRALKKLCSDLNISSEDVMVFGDSNNDLEMLSWAKWSFGMENATKEAKETARYITESNIEDGVAQAIEHYVLN